MIKEEWTWRVSSNNERFKSHGGGIFKTREACYSDMRRAVAEHIESSVNYYVDFQPHIHEGKIVEHGVRLMKDKIIHTTYDGVYTYEIKSFKARTLPQFTITGALLADTKAEVEVMEKYLQKVIDQTLKENDALYRVSLDIDCPD